MNQEATPGECPPVIAKPRLRRVWSILIAVVGGLLLEASLIYGAKRTGIWLAPVMGPFLFVPLLVLYFGVCWAVNRSRVAPRWMVATRIAFWLVPPLYFMVVGWQEGTPRARFETFVVKPMPASVQNFEWDGWFGMGGDHSVVITFKAAPEDTRRVVEAWKAELDPDSPWWDRTTESTNAAPAHQLNQALAAYCKNKVTFELLNEPVAYRLPQNESGRSWALLTDKAHRRVYLFLGGTSAHTTPTMNINSAAFNE